MSFFVNREGNISVVRVGTVLAVVGAIIIVGGLIIFQFENATYQAPLQIDPPPDATMWDQPTIISNTAQQVLYKIPNMTPQAVREYYQQKLDEYYGNNPDNPNREKCIRQPNENEEVFFEGADPGTGNLPYRYRCVFDRSGFQALQITEIFIEPGVRDDAKNINNEGITIVRYEQRWES